MGERAKEGSGIGTKRATRTVRIQLSRVLPGLALVLAVGAVAVRLMSGPRLDGPMILGAAGAALLLAIDMLLRPAAAVISAALDSEPLKELLDSAGPMGMAVGLDGRFTYLNPAAERMLCYNAAELKNLAHAAEILAPGQAERLVQEMLRLRAGAKASPVSADELLAAFMESVSSLPPSQVPSFEAQLCRKDGVIIPVTLHISAVRDGSGALTGLVAMALDQSAVLKQEQAVRESQERYRDLFENSSEMIATLSPGGQFLYANPAWKRCFGLDNAALLNLDSFEEVCGSGSRAEVAALFRRVLDGEVVDRAPLRNHTADGRVLELELTLSQRQKAGNPLAVRCLLRDVTQQKQREHRLALQLVVSQIVGENASPESAAMRILEALCSSQGWDVALKWEVNAEENRLEFCTAWGAPGKRTESLVPESLGLTMARGDALRA